MDAEDAVPDPKDHGIKKSGVRRPSVSPFCVVFNRSSTAMVGVQASPSSLSDSPNIKKPFKQRYSFGTATGKERGMGREPWICTWIIGGNVLPLMPRPSMLRPVVQRSARGRPTRSSPSTPTAYRCVALNRNLVQDRNTERVVK